MMFATLLTLALVYASDLASAQRRGGYGPAPAPAPAPAGQYGGYRPYAGPNPAELQLKTLDRQLGSLENREGQQEDKLARLIKSANANLDFQNDVQNYIDERIEQEQGQQNYRLDNLGQQIAQIRALRMAVRNLNDRWNASRDNVDSEVQPLMKRNQYEIKELQNADVEISDTSAALQQQADNINNRIDDTLGEIEENIRYLQALETNVRRIFDAVNRQRSASGSAELTANNPYATINFTPAFDGAPQAALVGLSAKHTTYTPAEYGYGYYAGYPVIYASVNTDLWNNQANFDLTDASSGGWQTEKYTLDADFIYFSNIEFFKEDLPVIA